MPDIYRNGKNYGSAMPAGGTTGQALVKLSNADGDVAWGDAGGAVFCYVVGDTPYAAGWLSLTPSGAALTPNSKLLYLILTDGEYYNNFVRWDVATSAYVPVSDGGVIINNTLLASGWDSSTRRQTLTFTGYVSSMGGVIGMPASATVAQKAAYSAAVIDVVAQLNNQFTFECAEIPSVDLPVTIYAGGGSGGGGSSADIGDLTDLHTTAKSTLVDAINEVDDSLGDLSALDTEEKRTLVGAVNEVLQDAKKVLPEIVAPNEVSPSEHVYSVGDQFFYEDILYTATESISVGDVLKSNVAIGMLSLSGSYSNVSRLTVDGLVYTSFSNIPVYKDSVVSLYRATSGYWYKNGTRMNNSQNTLPCTFVVPANASGVAVLNMAKPSNNASDIRPVNSTGWAANISPYVGNGTSAAPNCAPSAVLTAQIKAISAGGGHSIMDPAGQQMASRPNLQFKGLPVTDDSVNEAMVVDASGKADLTLLAPAFDPAESYSVDDKVTYQGKIYRFISDHEGAWDDADVIETVMDSEIPDVMTASDVQEVKNSFPSLTPTQPMTMFNYSTTEQVVGTWIDGKPLYQKVVTNITPTGAGTDAGISNVETLTDYVFIRHYSSTESWLVFWDGNDDKNSVVIKVEGGSIILWYRSANYNAGAGTLIVKYTKTTDPIPT